MSRLSRSQSLFVPKSSSRCRWAPVAPLTSTPIIGFAPPNVVLARDFFRVGLPAGDWSACDSECTPCDSMGQGGTQLVGARDSFVCQQNCTRYLLPLIACSVAGVTRSTPSAYSRAPNRVLARQRNRDAYVQRRGGTEASTHRTAWRRARRSTQCARAMMWFVASC